MASPITCIVTVHGIGFMQPPQTGQKNSGYADLLHEHLRMRLGTILSDDPNRVNRGENGAIYVESRYRNPNTGKISREEGLKRLGSWSQDLQHIQTKNAPLVANGERVSHIALVYSNLEPQRPEIGAALDTSLESLFAISHYAHISGLFQMVLGDIHAMVGSPAVESNQQSASSRPRTDLVSMLVKQQGNNGQAAPQVQASMLRNLADDVSCYVCHNAERERVRSFIYEALLRLASRDDVGKIVLNTHSNGTVVGLDVIRQLPQHAAAKIHTFITAGSPLRKYIDLFHWGHKIECPKPIKTWHNFWDVHDPVADPLEPPHTWRRGDKLTSPYDPTLFIHIDPNSGTSTNIGIKDIQIDNVQNSIGGGLQAHNYWDNEEQFVKPFARIMRIIAKN